MRDRPGVAHPSMVRVEKLSKSFGARPALEELSLTVSVGGIFGLLGHNGAGKSTTFGILLGQIHPDAGDVWIRDISVRTHRAEALRKVGAIFEAPAFYDYLSGWRNLHIFTAYSEEPVSDGEFREAVELVGLSGRIYDAVRTYSHGMRQRLALAQALLPRPQLLLLDEPTDGLDPEGIHEVRNLIRRLAHEQGMTILISSHQLSEMEHLCDHLAILKNGRVIFDGRWSELDGEVQRFRLVVDDLPAAREILAAAGVACDDEGLIRLAREQDIAAIVAGLVRSGAQIRAVEPHRRTLEEFYLETTNKL